MDSISNGSSDNLPGLAARGADATIEQLSAPSDDVLLTSSPKVKESEPEEVVGTERLQKWEREVAEAHHELVRVTLKLKEKQGRYEEKKEEALKQIAMSRGELNKSVQAFKAEKDAWNEQCNDWTHKVRQNLRN